MSESFEDKPTNGYRQDKKLIDYRLEEIDERLGRIEKSQQRQEVTLAKLETEFRIRVGVLGSIFGVVGAFVMWLVQWGVGKLWAG